MQSDAKKKKIGTILLFSISPLISLAIGAILSPILGCNSGASGISGCAISSFNAILDIMVSVGFLAVVTIPLGFLAILVVALNSKK